MTEIFLIPTTVLSLILYADFNGAILLEEV